MVGPGPLSLRLEAVGAVDSTNAELKRRCRARFPDAPLGLALWTTEQRAGYGQRGRAWVTPAGAGLAFSMALPAGPEPGAWPFRAGLAAHEALGRPEVGLKWVNDLVARGRKLGGILVEGLGAVVVVGVGVNLLPRAEAGPEAIALAELGAPAPDAPALAARLAEALARWADRPDWAGAWEALSPTIGTEVAVRPAEGDGASGEPEAVGRAVGLAPDGALRLLAPDGSERTIRHGRIRRLDGAYC